MFVTAAIVMLFAVPSWGTPVPTSNAATFYSSADFSHDHLADWLAASAIGDRLVLNNGTSYYRHDGTLSGVKNTKQKREPWGGICSPYHYTQTDVKATGTWWNTWNRAGPCNCCGLSDQQCIETLSASQTTGYSISAGLDIGIASAAKDSINGNVGLNLGFTWSESWTSSWTQSCPAGAHSSSSLWLQQNMGWADLQIRHGTSDGCGAPTLWGDYGPGHGDWPLGGSDNWNVNVNHGCSTGVNSGCNC